MEESTVVDELSGLRTRGYVADFRSIAGGQVQCGACGHAHPAAELLIESVARFEGASDPGDEAIVLGLVCRSCGTRGAFVAAYGPSASIEEAEVLTRLELPPI